MYLFCDNVDLNFLNIRIFPSTDFVGSCAPYKSKNIIDQLSRIEDLCIFKQDEGRGVVLMDRTKYTNKCLGILETNQFTKLNHDPTKSGEGKI